jgi:serine/threonine-protein kinase
VPAQSLGTPSPDEPVPQRVEQRPVSKREPTMRWQPSESGPRPVAGATWTATAQSPQQSPQPAWEPPAWASPPSSDVEHEEDLVGRVLADRYRIEASIGAGGMGVVYRATHVLIDKRVAVKVLRRRFAKQPDLSERFAREAKVASSIKHQHVVDVIDFGTTPGGSPFCVMEFLDGHSLAREIDQRGRLPPAFALELGIQVARGLAAAHQAGAIHRDLKPENVFLVPSEDVEGRRGVCAKILDFGIARLPANKLRLTAAGSVIGTPEYMSPEQARGDEVDARSDLYALGVMLFEALSGQVPLQGDSLAGTLTKQVFEAPPTLREIDLRLDGLPSIEAVLARLLAKSRDERPADALAVVRLLATAMANDLGGPDPGQRPQAALDGWSQGDGRGEAPRRRSTVMIGSGAMTSAHTAVRVGDGPATGDFDAKQGEVPSTGKRPSVIVEGGTPARLRPARVVAQPRTDLVAESARLPMPENVTGRTREPTPEPGPSRELRRRKRKRAFRQHLPVLALAVGAAIFAGLVTVGFVQWWQRTQGADIRGE